MITDENSCQLFENAEDMLTSKKLVEVIKHIKDNPPMVYCGKGLFERMLVKLNKGISQGEIDKIIKKHKGIKLPKEYTELLKFSNGISFFEYDNDVINSLEEAFEYSDEDWLDDGYINIAHCGEDDFYLKCDGSKRNIYFSSEGISELEPLNMSFVAFMEASLISGFSYFWQWGSDAYDLY